MDRVGNEEVRRRAGIERELTRRDQRVLRWFGHVKRMDEYRMAIRVLMGEISGGRVLVRPSLGWMDGINVLLGSRGMAVEGMQQCAKDGKERRALLHMWMIKFNEAVFALPCVFSDHPPASWWIITWREVGSHYMMLMG